MTTEFLTMNIKYWLLTGVLVILVQSGFAQKISVRGTIIDSESLENLSGVHIFLEPHIGTVSDLDGNFHFEVAYQDTLHFTRIGYESLAIVILDTDEYQQFFITIKRSIRILDAVEVHARFQSNTIIQLPRRMVYRVPGIKYPDVPGEKNYRMGLGAVMSPMTALYRMFSKRYKEEKKYYQIQKVQKVEEALYAKAKENLAAAFELSTYYLDEYFYRDFIRYSGLTSRFIAESTEYELLGVLPFAIKQYTKHLEDQ